MNKYHCQFDGETWVGLSVDIESDGLRFIRMESPFDDATVYLTSQDRINLAEELLESAMEDDLAMLREAYPDMRFGGGGNDVITIQIDNAGVTAYAYMDGRCAVDIYSKDVHNVHKDWGCWHEHASRYDAAAAICEAYRKHVVKNAHDEPVDQAALPESIEINGITYKRES